MRISDSTFIISTNGFADGPAQALRDYLVQNKARRVTVITHPLVPENRGEHIIEKFTPKGLTVNKYRAPNKPPFTYPLDFVIPLRLPKADVWFGFNNLAALRGLGQRRKGRVKKVVYWGVDFVPQRFGKSKATSVYDKVDKKVCEEVDLWVDLSEAARSGRAKYHGLAKKDQAPSIVAPMGAWFDETPKLHEKSWDAQKVVYLGHLVERQGVKTLIDALAIVAQKNRKMSADVVGGGPLLEELKKQTKRLGLQKTITFHGFVKDHKEVDKILATGTVAAAPYKVYKESFTQFADPGKLKAYLGAGLPIVLTPVPPNTQELKQARAALVVNDSAQALAAGLERILNQKTVWQKAHKASLKLAEEFDWNKIMHRTLVKIGVE